jgi:hypothetical protein
MKNKNNGNAVITICWWVAGICLAIIGIRAMIADDKRADAYYAAHRTIDITNDYSPLPSNAEDCKFYLVGDVRGKSYGRTLLVTCPNKSVTVSTPSGKNPQSTITVQ